MALTLRWTLHLFKTLPGLCVLGIQPQCLFELVLRPLLQSCPEIEVSEVSKVLTVERFEFY